MQGVLMTHLVHYWERERDAGEKRTTCHSVLSVKYCTIGGGGGHHLSNTPVLCWTVCIFLSRAMNGRTRERGTLAVGCLEAISIAGQFESKVSTAATASIVSFLRFFPFPRRSRWLPTEMSTLLKQNRWRVPLWAIISLALSADVAPPIVCWRNERKQDDPLPFRLSRNLAPRSHEKVSPPPPPQR